MSVYNSHDASGQMVGYLYQILAALKLLLDSREENAQICIEKFDDIAFAEQDEPTIMVQTKHHLNHAGSLTNTSVDLWRTINSWCDSKESSPTNLQDTDFIILTTAIAAENSAAYFLKRNSERDIEKASKILNNAAIDASVAANERFYRSFLSYPQDFRDSLLRHVFIYDNSSNIEVIKSDIMSYIRYSTLPVYAEKVYDSVVGWWIRAVISSLCSDQPVFINRIQLHQMIYDFSSSYRSDSLPIEIDFAFSPSTSDLDELIPENRVFIEQLNLVTLSNKRIRRCIREYYNAFKQRSIWVREQLLLVNELQEYEAVLVDEWNRLFTIMAEDLSDYGDELTEQQKINAGRHLFGVIEELNLPIRERVSQPFIMRGSYHDLANRMKVGWHVDFMDRLCYLLKE